MEEGKVSLVGYPKYFNPGEAFLDTLLSRGMVIFISKIILP